MKDILNNFQFMFFICLDIQFKVERDSDTDETLSLERSYHEQFIESHSRLFVGRESLLNAIHSHCERSRRSSTPNVPLVILGEPGAGHYFVYSSHCNSFQWIHLFLC
jgi:hypothetical protein